jgi:transcription elongation GreA/GreB family factor
MERLGQLRDSVQRLGRTVLPSFPEGAAITLGALVDLDQEDGQPVTCFVAAYGAGIPLKLDGRSVLVVTPQSPLGRALVGRTEGEVIVVDTAQGPKDYEVTAVR